MTTSWQWQSWYAKCNQQTQQTSPFISERPCHFWEQNHRSHVFMWVTTITDFNANNVNNNSIWLAHCFLCHDINIQLFLICNSPWWLSCQCSCVHVGCSVFWASETCQKCKCLQKLHIGTHTTRSLWSVIYGGFCILLLINHLECITWPLANWIAQVLEFG